MVPLSEASCLFFVRLCSSISFFTVLTGVATGLETPFESFEAVEAERVRFFILSDVLGVLAFLVDPFSFPADELGDPGVLGLLLPLIDFCGTGVEAELVVVTTMGFFPLVSLFDLLRFGFCSSLVSCMDKLLDPLPLADEVEVVADLGYFALLAAQPFLALVSPPPSLFPPPDRVLAIRFSRINTLGRAPHSRTATGSSVVVEPAGAGRPNERREAANAVPG